MIKYKVGVYVRLSREDIYSESDSIENQTRLIENYCSENNLTVINKYVDNGYSGTNFNRPDFQRMLEDIKLGVINTIVVKDLSRLGRNYIYVGYYLESCFPNYNVRFISINDDFDSIKHKNIMERLDVPLKNMLYDHYAYETSKKIKSSMRQEKANGKFIGSSVIYGYKKSTIDIHDLEIDDEAADVVRNIYNMFLLGMTKTDIANNLNKQNIDTPSVYKLKHGLGFTKSKKDNKWNYEIINRILTDENYTGKLVQGRKRNENYKTHKEIKVPKKDWIVCDDHHEAIIDYNIFLKVQEILKNPRRSSNKNDIFAGYLFCGDCNGPMTLIKGKKNEYYYCRNNLSKKICSKHTIRKDYLTKELIDKINIKLVKKKDKVDIINREVLNKYVDRINIYEDNIIEVILKYESKLINK